MTWREVIEAALAFVFIAVGGLAFGWFRILKETNTLLKEQNEELKADNKQWQEKHSDNVAAIAKLQGQIDTLKNVPLKQINNSINEIAKTNKAIVETQKQIVELLGKDKQCTKSN